MKSNSFCLYHRIGGILFKTISDVYIPAINKNFLKCFLSSKQLSDANFQIQGIKSSELTLPPLTTYEREQFQNCKVTSRLGGGIQTIPLVIILNEIDRFKPYLKKLDDGFEVPLLNSPIVRKELNDSLVYGKQVVIFLHSLTVEIRNYATHQLNIFYVEEMKSVLQSDLMDAGLERMFRAFLPEFNALMVHSSAAIRKEKAVLFLAPDEGGKTTVVKQVIPATVIGDDQVILRKQNEEYLIYPTPWGNIVNISFPVPLGACFLLEKADHFDLVPFTPRQMIEFLWAEHTYFTDFIPKSSRKKAFNLICDSLHKVPTYKMSVPINGVDWRAIDACL